MTETKTSQAKSYEPLLARIITEAGAPWVINIVASLLAGVVVGAPWWGVFVAMVCGGIPMFVILGGMRRGQASDHHVTDIKQRRWVLPAILGIVVVGLVIELVAGAPRELIAWTAAALVVLVGIGVITIAGHWKVSVHTAVAGGTTVLLAMMASPWILLALPLTAAIGWSRVWLGDHTREQVLAGAGLGIVLAAGTYLLVS